MGGKSSSSSSSKTDTTTSTTQIDRRVGIEGGGIVATDGSEIDYTVTDVSENVVRAALEEALGFGADFGARALDLAGAAVDELADTKTSELSKFTELAQGSVENINAAKANFDKLIMGAVAIAGVFLLTRVMK